MRTSAPVEAERPLPAQNVGHAANDGMLSLSWEEDYRGNVKRMLLWTFLHYGLWSSSLFVGLFCMLNLACDYTRGTIIQPDGLILFALGTVVALTFRLVIVYGEQQQRIPDKKSRVFVTLQVHADGINIVRGQNRYTASWQHVSRIGYGLGLVSLRQNLLQVIVPASAFHSENDAEWLARTMKDLKNGTAPQAYDWSSYGVAGQSRGGVWPPPIIPQ